MTDTTLNKILTNINNSFYNQKDFALRNIDSKIDIININAKHCIDLNRKDFYDFILLKNKNLNSKIKYIGIIFDMIDDLHFYILLNFRKQNYLQDSLNNSIFPFLSCYKNRKKQRLSFKKLKIKEYFIKQFGFISTGNFEVEKDLNCDDIQLYDGKSEKSFNLTSELKEQMINNLNDAIVKLRMINKQINYYKYKSFDAEEQYLEDLYWEIKDDITFSI